MHTLSRDSYLVSHRRRAAAQVYDKDLGRDDVLGTLDCQKTFESDVEGIDLRAGDAAVLARAVHRPRPVPENEKRMAFVLFFSEINKTS